MKKLIGNFDIKNYFKNIKAITKFPLSTMNAGMVFYSYSLITPMCTWQTSIPLFTGNLLIAMATQVKGQILEVDQDIKMDRTKNRPLPAQLMNINEATKLNKILLASANAILIMSNINWQSILTSNVIYLSYIQYVQMKRKTSFNTLYGAVVGALPIIVGFLAVKPLTQLDISHLMTFNYLFLWQFIHFYGILIGYEKDYEKTDFKFLKNKQAIIWIIFISLIAQILCGYFLIEKKKEGVQQETKNFFSLTFYAIFIQHLMFCKYVNNYRICPISQNGFKLKYISYKLFAFFYMIIYWIFKMNQDQTEQKKTENKIDINQFIIS